MPWVARGRQLQRSGAAELLETERVIHRSLDRGGGGRGSKLLQAAVFTGFRVQPGDHMPAGTLAAPLLGGAPEEPSKWTDIKLLLSHVLTKFGSKAWEVTLLIVPASTPLATSQLTTRRAIRCVAVRDAASAARVHPGRPGCTHHIRDVHHPVQGVCWDAMRMEPAPRLRENELTARASRPACGRSLSLDPHAAAGWTAPTGCA